MPKIFRLVLQADIRRSRVFCCGKFQRPEELPTDSRNPVASLPQEPRFAAVFSIFNFRPRFPMKLQLDHPHFPRAPVLHQTVLRSDMTLMILPGPAISTNFSCQLSKTLIAWPPPSPPPLECICEKPVGCGDIERVEADEGCELWDMPLYL